MAVVRLNPTINFFATPDEMAAWLGVWVREYQLYYALTRHPSTVFTLDVPWEDRAKAVQLVREHTRVFLRPEPIQTRVKNANYLHSANPGMLSITLPVLTPQGLRFGLLGTSTQDPAYLRVWERIGSDFLCRTAVGMWVVCPPPVNCKTFDTNYRYSPGAAELWQAGVPLRGAGTDTWHIEEPPTPAVGVAGES